MSPPAVADAPDRARFEIRVAGEVAGFVTYRRRDGELALLHTEIDDAHQGEGLAARLVRDVLDRARVDGLAVVPYCPYVAGYLARHPEYLDLVPEQHRHLCGGRRP